MTGSEVEGYLVLAREDLEVADRLLATHGRQAAFHLQQAAEKLVKAVLTAEGLPFPRSHQVGALAALLPADHPWRADLAALDGLTAYATALRYPMPGGGLPPAPETPELAASRRELGALLDAVGPWCRDRLTAGGGT